MSKNAILFRIRSVINPAYRSATDKDYRSIKVKAHKVGKISISFIIRRNYAVQQALKAVTWSS